MKTKPSIKKEKVVKKAKKVVEVSINGVTLADLESVLSRLTLGPEFSDAMRLMFKIAAAAVNENRAAAMAVAAAGFMPIAEGLSYLVTGVARAYQNRQNAEAIGVLRQTMNQFTSEGLDADVSAFNKKLLSRASDLLDQAFPGDFKLTLGDLSTDLAAIQPPAPLDPDQPPAPLEINKEEFMRDSPPSVEEKKERKPRRKKTEPSPEAAPELE